MMYFIIHKKHYSWWKIDSIHGIHTPTGYNLLFFFVTSFSLHVWGSVRILLYELCLHFLLISEFQGYKFRSQLLRYCEWLILVVDRNNPIIWNKTVSVNSKCSWSCIGSILLSDFLFILQQELLINFSRSRKRIKNSWIQKNQILKTSEHLIKVSFCNVFNRFSFNIVSPLRIL